MTLLSRSPGGALVFGFLGVATAAWPGPAAGTPPQRAPPPRCGPPEGQFLRHGLRTVTLFLALILNPLHSRSCEENHLWEGMRTAPSFFSSPVAGGAKVS